MKRILCMVVLFICWQMNGQTYLPEQFASSVISFSSEYNATDYSASQILGAPNRYPSCTGNLAWAQSSQNDGMPAGTGREFIELGFSTPQPVSVIRIYQTRGAGSVDTIYLRNASNGVWIQVFSRTADADTCVGLLFEVSIPTTAFNADAIRIAINSSIYEWQEFDAVSILNRDQMAYEWKQYVASVISFSTEYSPADPDWNAIQTIGAPNASYSAQTNGGYSGCNTQSNSWAPVNADGQREFLVLGFAYPARANRIRVFQPGNPGAIDTIFLRDATTGDWHQVFSTTASALICPRYGVYEINFTTTSYPVDAVRIAMNSPAVSGYHYIDAVELTSELPPNAARTSQAGNWSSNATWASGVPPAATDTVIIGAGHNVTLDVSDDINGLFINTGGTLTVSNASTLTIGPAGGGSRQMVIEGSLTMSSGNIQLNGGIRTTSGSVFNMSGGDLVVDGNNGTPSESVPAGVHIIDFVTGMSSFSFTGGTLTIVDPPANAGSNALRSAYNFGNGSTLRIGNGLSGTAGVNVNGFGGNTVPAQVHHLVIDAITVAGNRQFRPTIAMTVNGNLTVTSGRYETSGVNTTVMGDVVVADSLSQANNLRIVGDLTINSGAVLFNAVNSSMAVGGNLLNNGSMSFSFTYFANNFSTASVNPQTIGGTGTYNPHGNGTFFINNTNVAGVTLNRNISLVGVSLISGKLFIGNFDLTLSGSISGSPSLNNYIVTNGTGRLVASGATLNFTAHIGPDATSYNPVVHTVLSGHSFAYHVRIGFDVANPPLSNSVVNRQWTIDDLTGGAINSTLTFQWNAAHEDPTFDRTASYVGRYDGTMWQPVSSPSAAAASNPYIKTVSNVTAFSPFGVGSSGALPVRLLGFEAKKISQGIFLEWIVENETAFSHYGVERSSDGRVFSERNVVQALNRSGQSWYSYTDGEVMNSVVYYRLKMVELDGSFTYSRVVKIDPAKRYNVQLYPVPAKNKLHLEGLIHYEQIQMLDAAGRLVMTMSNSANQVELDVSHLRPGTYLIRLTGKTDSQSLLFLKH